VTHGRLGPVVEVGRPPVPSVPFVGPDAHCAGDDVLAVWIESEAGSGGRGAEHRIAVKTGDAWVISEPVRGRLDCLPGRAVVTRVEGDDTGTTITRTDCSASGCSTAEVFVADVTARASVAPIGDRVVVIWIDDLVRARIAEIGDLASAPTLPLFDGYDDHRSYEYQGQAVIRRLALHVRGHSAIVELHGDDTMGIHLSADGTAQPIRVVYP
jgi:hypothetical protein